MIAAGNLIGPLVLGPLFDTIGRKIMVAGMHVLPERRSLESIARPLTTVDRG